MTGIGTLIKAIRVEKKLTVSEACESICSERFMYMIENNNRIPSAEIIKKLGERFELNIYDYLDLIGFKCPVNSKNLIDHSRNVKLTRNYRALENLTDQMEKLDDRFKEPLCYELVGNHVFLELFFKKKPQLAYKKIEESLLRIVNVNIDWIVNNNHFVNDYYYMMFMNYMFIYYRTTGHDQKARDILNYLWRVLHKSKHDKKFEMLYVSIVINYLYDHIFIYKSINHESELDSLLEFQMKTNQLNRVFFTYFLLSGHYYNENKIEKAKEYFKLMIAAGMSVSDQMQFQDLIDGLDPSFVNDIYPNRTFDILF
ncbi:helix-turn-helix transcriptional regulator [Fusibacter bizertensis]|uniref:Helix-turn-helix transcriptional regulator n=1 Tax=Fusibacter bizertensis TaxID=1488331 RepID=A0ABT6NF06_9FIRM|nr:helix-turn-helix transcriptional regulator [Fusibacter bizertensis]MDH8679012.1 helix-turn-helix transcriptional regulator [Fusibacter bizertensis]